MGAEMANVVKLLFGLGLLLVAILAGLYGLFAILYGGDSGGGDSYVTVGGREIDADLVGALALLLAFLAGGAALLSLSWRRSRRADRSRPV
jgi:Zn-dependent protease with chaperone function